MYWFATDSPDCIILLELVWAGVPKLNGRGDVGGSRPEPCFSFTCRTSNQLSPSVHIKERIPWYIRLVASRERRAN
jgi:hypothetical protein